MKHFQGLVKKLTPQLEQKVQRLMAQQRLHQAEQQHCRGGGVGM